ncbi:MAG: anaerobic selenocysteine-containing dehydrogenase, partial [Planctomycetota bacterium]
TNPDGCTWIEMLEDESKIGCHVALTPTWSETAQWADYVLPMGLSAERHDLMSQETHAGTWLGFRQPVLREYNRLEGLDSSDTRDSNPGEVWEEAEFYIALTWEIDPDGSMGIRKYYESKENPGQPISMDEYWSDVFSTVKGLPETAAAEGQTPLEYMRRRGAYSVPYAGQKRYEEDDANGVELENGDRKKGFPTPSKKLEFFSKTLSEWSFDDQAIPGYIRSQVHWGNLDTEKGERCLLPTFRLPTLIHTRSGNAKWLQEISHTNPLWVHPSDIGSLGLANGELARVSTSIGYFVVRVWETEGIHPGVVGCSHHVGRWRLYQDIGGQKICSDLVDIERGEGTFLFRAKNAERSYDSSDPDTSRVWWKEVGVNQNLTFGVQPDPASGMQCWHQKVRVEPAHEGDRYADVFVDTNKSIEVYEEWKALTRPPTGKLRRPLWLNRPLKPLPEAYRL